MKQKLLFQVLATACVVSFNACTETREFPIVETEDISNAETTFDRLTQIVDSYKEGLGYRFAKDFFGFQPDTAKDAENEGTILSETGIYKNLFDALGTVIDKKALAEYKASGLFVMSSFSGIYEWDINTKSWDKKPAKDILMLFPSHIELENNDSELYIMTYNVAKFVGKDGQCYKPVSFDLTLKRDKVQVCTVDLTARYGSTGAPEYLSFNLYSKPVSVNLALTLQAENKYHAVLKITDESEKDNWLTVTADIFYADEVTDADVAKIDSLDLSVSMESLDFSGVMNIGETTVGGRSLQVKYSDGSIEDFSEYSDRFIAELKALFGRTHKKGSALCVTPPLE